MLIAGNRNSREGGFTYVMVLVAVVVIGLTVGTASRATSHIVQADREAELLFRGYAYQQAIKSYYETGKAPVFPRALADLVNDPRAVNKPHLRTLYADPFGGAEGQWSLIRAPDGGISGVVSVSTKKPIKQANFPKALEKFRGAGSHAGWVFQHVPPPPQSRPPAPRPPVR